MLPRLMRLMIIAGLVLPVASCGGGSKTSPLLAGTWEVKDKNKSCTVEFTKDGKVRLSGDTQLFRDFQFAKLLADFNLQPGLNTPITYRAVDEKTLEIEGDYSALAAQLGAGAGDVAPGKVKEMQNALHPQDQVTYVVTAKELTLTSSQGKSLSLKRVE